MSKQQQILAFLQILTILHAFAFAPIKIRSNAKLSSAQIVSPFSDNEPNADVTATTILELTEENVELVLDEMRHFLQADGGDVALTEIDGPVVKLELQVIFKFIFKFSIFC